MTFMCPYCQKQAWKWLALLIQLSTSEEKYCKVYKGALCILPEYKTLLVLNSICFSCD